MDSAAATAALALSAAALAAATAGGGESAATRKLYGLDNSVTAEFGLRCLLARRMAEGAAQSKLLIGLAEAFDLDAPPKRIEIYDNAHIQGSDAVGGMVVAGPEGFIKGQYRKFNIKQAATDDDFAMMREVFQRRFARAQEDDPDRDSGQWPDLVLIDGDIEAIAPHDLGKTGIALTVAGGKITYQGEGIA